MAITFACQCCGRTLQARDGFVGKRGECPYCGSVLPVPQHSAEPVRTTPVTPVTPAATEIRQFFDPPSATHAEERPRARISVRRMFEALLDPRSIQWMLTLGGALSVLGLIVWLTSLGIFENKLVLASATGLGSLAILGSGWWISLKTRLLSENHEVLMPSQTAICHMFLVFCQFGAQRTAVNWILIVWGRG